MYTLQKLSFYRKNVRLIIKKRLTPRAPYTLTHQIPASPKALEEEETPPPKIRP